MMTIRKEWGLSLAIGVVVAVTLILLVSLFSSATSDHKEIITYLRSADERLTAMEAGKAKATAKRFTSDDGAELIECLRLPYAERAPCLDVIAARFN